jgi:hypothetical protein
VTCYNVGLRRRSYKRFRQRSQWKFFRQRRGRHQELTEQHMEGNCQTVPANRDRAMLEGKRAMVEVSAQRLRTCCRG